MPRLRIGEVRRGQLITTFGIGSIIDLSDYSVMIMGQDFWRKDECEVIHEERLERKFRREKNINVDSFLRPKAKKNPFNRLSEPVVPGIRFPEWVFCQDCRHIAHYDDFGGVAEKRCRICSRERKSGLLIPSRFVIACGRGHIDDFPWVKWTHRGTSCKNPRLKIEQTGLSTALSSIVVKCESCHAKNDLGEIFRPNSLARFGSCKGRRPWLGKDNYEPHGCGEPLVVLQRGSASVYFPVLESAISIPPFSSAIHAFLRPHWDTLKFTSDENTLATILKSILEGTGANFDLNMLMNAVKSKKFFMDSDDTRDIRPDEYIALCAPPEKDPESDFYGKPENIPDKFKDLISHITLVHRLREIRVIYSFTRIEPDTLNLAPLSSRQENWLPAMEVNGEGIFIELSASGIKAWKDQGGRPLINRIQQIEAIRRSLQTEGNWVIQEVIKPEFILVHTLAHLVIRQLTLECGYSSSALRERIYTSDGSNGMPPMHGFLIYTGSADSEGGLGGLVRQGKKERIEEILLGILEQARWCSSDPLCIESTGQGMNSLNLAACHACLLLPETACEYRNCYLDRGVIVGVAHENVPGYFERFY